MSIKFDLYCDVPECCNPISTDTYPDEQLLLLHRLQQGWCSVQIQYDSDLKTWWLCPECVTKLTVQNCVNLMKSNNAATP